MSCSVLYAMGSNASSHVFRRSHRSLSKNHVSAAPVSAAGCLNAQSSFSSALVCNPVSGQRVRTMSSHFTQESCHLSTSLRATPTSTPPLPATATCRRSSGLRSLASVEQITMTGDQGGDGRKDILLVGKAAVVLTACSMLFLASDQQSVATPHHRHQPHMGIPLPPSNHQSPNVPHTTVVAATSETSEQAITFAKDVMDQVTTKPEKHSDRIVDTTTASALANSSSTEYLDGRRVYDISIGAIQGGRVNMEDEYFVADGGRFAAVFDGHGGGGVSSFLKRNLHRSLMQKLQEFREEELFQCSTLREPTVACQVAALRAAFSHVDDTVMRDDALQYQGSTAVAVLLHDCDDGHRTLLSANVGDSRAILSRKGRAVELTRDHKPNEEREKARILSMGETIEWDRYAKVHRVRDLSLSRAIGDRWAKPVVSGEVEIRHFPINENDDEFVLLASDGLWDVMTSQDVVSFVHKWMESELSRDLDMDSEERERHRIVLRKKLSKIVASEAIRRGSGDNVCVVMVWLDEIKSSDFA